MKKSALFIFLLYSICLIFCLSAAAETPDYSESANWAYYDSSKAAAVDVFFIAPTNVGGDADHLNANLDDPDEVYAIQWSIGMQTGIYGTKANFYAPYYRQITMSAYALPETEREAYLAIAEQDVLSAFRWYMDHENNGRPVIIAGFSQGADMGLRILKAYADDLSFQAQLVAAYLIGWRVTPDDLAACPSLRMAQGESDTGVIITFDCEAESVTDTFIVPKGVFTYSINPLTWKTDSTPASKNGNLGYVYPDRDGSVKEEIPQLCGCYIDPDRGVLKVTDVTPEEYPARIALFPDGAYHIYDYEFFYRNLQKNVETRINAYLARLQ